MSNSVKSKSKRAAVVIKSWVAVFFAKTFTDTARAEEVRLLKRKMALLQGQPVRASFSSSVATVLAPPSMATPNADALGEALSMLSGGVERCVYFL